MHFQNIYDRLFHYGNKNFKESVKLNLGVVRIQNFLINRSAQH